MRIDKFQRTAKRILKLKGFTHIKKRAKGCDFQAKKDDMRYLIEVKGTEQRKRMMKGPTWC